MLTTLALAVALGLAPSQAGKLDLTNVRPTYGILGAPRANSQVLPGDSFWLSFDVDKVQANKDGKAVYTMGFEVQDSKGKVLLKEEEDTKRPRVADMSVGGNRLPIFAHAD